MKIFKIKTTKGEYISGIALDIVTKGEHISSYAAFNRNK